MTYTFSTLMKRFLSAFFVCALSLMAFRGEGQNYIQLEDASGYNFTDAAKVTEIEAAVNELIQTFPAQFQNDFKVFDFGFYLHQESYSGGFPEAFQTKLNQIAGQSPYYLAFGKQTDANGIYTQFWVALNLPDSDKFACLDQVNGGLRNSFHERISSHANLQHRLNDLVPDTYYESELSAINELNSLLTMLWGCCDGSSNAKSGETCVFCYEEGYQVLEQMISEGFVLQEIEIPENGDPDYFDTGSGGLAAVGQKKESKTGVEKNAANANITFKFRGDPEEWDLDGLINTLVADPHVSYLNHRLDLSLTSGNIGKHFYKYPRDCSVGFSESAYQDYENDASDLKIIVCVININSKIGILGYKTDVSAAFQQSTRNNPQLKDEVVIAQLHKELDALGADKISEQAITYLRKRNPPNFFSLTSLEDPTKFQAYADAASRYETASSINVSEKFRQLWTEEYNFYVESANSSLSRGQDLVSKIMVNWNMGSYAIRASSSIFNYRRTRNEVVLEMLLGFECARNSTIPEEQSSFTFLYTAGIKSSNSRRANLDYLLEGINITYLKIEVPEGIYQVSVETVVSGAVNVAYPLTFAPGFTEIQEGVVFIQGANGFKCDIFTATPAEADQLRDKFNGGIGQDLTTVYQEDADLLRAAADHCNLEDAKKILASTPACVITQLDNESRIKLINCLSRELWVGETEEVFILKLLQAVEDPCDFIAKADQLVSFGGLNASNLIKAIDYPVPSKALLGNLIAIFSACHPNISTEETKGIFSVRDGLSKYGFTYEKTAAEVTGSNKLIVVIEETRINQPQPAFFPPSRSESIPLGLFDPVSLIIDVGAIENVGISGNVELTNIPALAMVFIINNFTKQEVKAELNTALNIALFTLGAAEVGIAARLITAAGGLTRGNAIRLGLGVIDLGATFADTYCQDNPSSDLCKEWQKVSFYIAIGLLSYTVKDAITVATSSVGSRLSLIENEYKDFDEVKKLLAELNNSKFTDEVRDLLANFSNDLKIALNNDLTSGGPAFFNFLRDNPGGVRAWEAFKDSPDLRTNVPLLAYTSEHFDELPVIKRGLEEVSDQDAFIANLNNRPFTHTPTSGAIVYSHLEHGTYLIGGFPPDLQPILDQLGYPKMDPLDLSFPIPEGQRFNLLNVSDDVYQVYVNADIGFFRSVNGPWIDHGVSQGVPIIAVSDVTQNLYKIEDGVQSLTGFGKEVHRLEWIHGYRYDATTKRMLPPSESSGLPTLTNLSDYDHGL